MSTIKDRTGEYLNCTICGTEFYRKPSYVKRGIRITCGKTECKSESMRGANNPFGGKKHSPETIKRINDSIRARPIPKRKGGPPKGYKHTPEALAKMKESMLRRWKNTRDLMLSQREHLKILRPREKLRYRRNFSAAQRDIWLDKQCLWCRDTSDLVLDHIIPVMCGGENARENAQTLCQTCNRWKLHHVDKQLFIAGLGKKRG